MRRGSWGPGSWGQLTSRRRWGRGRSQAQGTEQVRFPGRPELQGPRTEDEGWWVRAGERRGQMGGQEGEH